MLSITKEQLLKDREELIRQLTFIDGMLESRFGWKDASVKPKEASATPQKTIANENRDIESLSYMGLAREWVSGHHGQVTAKLFGDWLINKLGEDRVNRSSLSAPLKKLCSEGALVLIKSGTGRAQTVYRTPNAFEG